MIITTDTFSATLLCHSCVNWSLLCFTIRLKLSMEWTGLYGTLLGRNCTSGTNSLAVIKLAGVLRPVNHYGYLGAYSLAGNCFKKKSSEKYDHYDFCVFTVIFFLTAKAPVSRLLLKLCFLSSCTVVEQQVSNGSFLNSVVESTLLCKISLILSLSCLKPCRTVTRNTTNRSAKFEIIKAFLSLCMST